MKKRDIIISSVILLLFIVISIFVLIEKTSIIDTLIYSITVDNMTNLKTIIFKCISFLGSGKCIFIISILFLVIPKTRKTYGISIFSAIAISETLNLLLKYLCKRPRPDILRLVEETSYSFPSGHAMVNATLYTMIALIALNSIKDKKIKTILVTFCVGMACIIGITRIYLGVHYFTDVFCGWLLGFLVSFVLFNILKNRRKVG